MKALEKWWGRGHRSISLAAFLCWFLGSTFPVGAENGLLRLSVGAGVKRALEEDEEVQMAAAQLEMAKERVREERAGILPQLSATVDYNRNWLLPSFIFDGPTGSQKVQIGTDNNINGALQLRQSLYGGGGLKSAIKAADLLVDYYREGQRLAHQQVASVVEGQFYHLLLAQELVQVGKRALKSAGENLRQVKALERAGRAAEFEVLQAQVRVAQWRADSLRAENERILAESDLKNSLKLPLDQAFGIEAAFRQQTALPLDDWRRLVEIAQEERPQIRQYAKQIAAQQRQVKVERALGRPTVDLVARGQMQFQSNEFDLGQDKEWQRSWSTGISLAVPLFDGKRASARSAGARAELRRLELALERARRDLALEVRQAWLSVGEVQKQLQAQQTALEHAEKGLKVAEARYRNGMGTQLEVLEAQLSMVQAQTLYATAQRDRALSLVELERAVGVVGQN